MKKIFACSDAIYFRSFVAVVMISDKVDFIIQKTIVPIDILLYAIIAKRLTIKAMHILVAFKY